LFFRSFLAVAALLLLGLIAPVFSASSTTGDLAGVVKDGRNRVLPNATVRISVGPAIKSARTDAKGKYLIRDLPPGDYTVIAQKPAYTSAQRSAVPITAAVTTNLDFKLDWGDTTSGGVEVTIQTTRKVPLPGATVTLFRGASLFLEGTTDGLGTLIFAGLPPDQYSVRSQRPGFVDSSTTRPFRVRAGDMTRVTLPMQRDANQIGQLGGLVTDLSGTPLANVNVRIAAGLTLGETKTNGAGRYLFEGLIPGDNYAVEASLTGFATQLQANITVNQLQQTIVNFAMVASSEDKGSITGIISDATGEPVPFAKVTVTSGPGAGQNVQANGDGRYVLSELAPAGNYALIVEQPGFNPAGRSGIEVGAEETTVIDFTLVPEILAPGRISGTVREAGGGIILAGVLVELTAGASEGLAAVTDGAGHYEIRGVRPDDAYTVRFSKNGYDSLSQPNVLVQSGTITTLNAEISPRAITEGALAGTVFKTSGRPFAGVKMTLFRGPSSPLTVVTGTNGTYRFANVRPGNNYGVRASKEGFTTVEKTGITVTAGSETRVNFTVKKAPELGSIHGLVVDLLLRPIENAHVRVLEGPAEPDEVSTNEQGRFTLDGLPEGQYTLQVTAVGFRSQIIPRINVTPGRITNITVPMLQ